MTVLTEWDNEARTIVRVVYPEQWTMDDFYAAINNTGELILSREHTVHIINDFSAAAYFPRAILTCARHLERTSPSNAGLYVFVGLGMIRRSFYTALSKLAPDVAQRVRFTHTLEEARALISAEEVMGT